jgi:hypothetical protein
LAPSSSARGREIAEGTVYRRIHPNHFDYDVGVPTFLAFRPREIDKGGLSADVDLGKARAALKQPQHKRFGLCALDIAKIKQETKGTAQVKPLLKAGASHVRIENFEDEEVQQALARLATVLQLPTR